MLLIIIIGSFQKLPFDRVHAEPIIKCIAMHKISFVYADVCLWSMCLSLCVCECERESLRAYVIIDWPAKVIAVACPPANCKLTGPKGLINVLPTNHKCQKL